MPVLAVKSFESSTNALAGSHAAQHKVSCLVSAPAGLPTHEATTTAVAPNARIIWLITQPPCCRRRLPACPADHTSPFGVYARETSIPFPQGIAGSCLVLLLSVSLPLNILGVNGRLACFRKTKLLLHCNHSRDNLR